MKIYKDNSNNPNKRMKTLNAAHQIVTRSIGTLEMNCKTDPQIPQLCRLIDRINREKKLLVEGDADDKF